MENEQELDKLRRVVLVLIGIRLALSLVVFVGKIFVTKQSSLRLIPAYVSPFGLIALLPQLIPLVWLIPAFFLYRGEKTGFTLATRFAPVLLMLNILGAFFITISPVSGALSLVLVLLAAAIFYFSQKAGKYFGKEEKQGTPMSVNEDRADVVKWAFFVTAGTVTALGGLFTALLMVGLASENSAYKMPVGIVATLTIVTFLAGGYVGSRVAVGLRKSLEEGKQSAGFEIASGAQAGALCGALAQLTTFGMLFFKSALSGNVMGLLMGLLGYGMFAGIGAAIGMAVGMAFSLPACSLAKSFMVRE